MQYRRGDKPGSSQKQQLTICHTNQIRWLTYTRWQVKTDIQPGLYRVSDDDPPALFRLTLNEPRTFVAEVVHEDDLGDELRRRAVEDAVNGAQQRRPALVMEGDDDAGVGKIFCV